MSYIEGVYSSPERKGREQKKLDEDSLSEQRLGNHLAAYGNHEGKAGLLAKMKPDATYTQGPLAQLVNPDNKQIWSKKVPMNWCQISLEPNGLVTRENDAKRSTIGYEKTKEGEDLGKAFGGHLLELSENLPVSLYQLSGSTASASKTKIYETEEGEQREIKERAPLTRFRIAKILVTSDLPMREVDMVTSLQTEYPGSYDSDNAQAIIKPHLQNLAEAGVIVYESRKADTNFSFYRPVATRPDGHLPPYRTQYALTNRVDRLLSQTDKPLSIPDVYDTLIKEYPHYRNNKENALKITISGVLAHLAREGYANNEGFNKEVRSAINLSPSQKEMLGRFVDLGEKFRSLDPDFLQEGRKKARAIVKDKERFTALMEKAYKASKNTQKKDPSETSEKILSYVKDHPRSTNNDIQTYLQESRQNIGQTRIKKLTRMLRADGKLMAAKEKTKLFYSVPEKSQASTEETVIFKPDTSA